MTSLRDFLRSLGLSDPGSQGRCNTLDDAFDGMTWQQILEARFMGVSIWTYIRTAALADPTLIPGLLGSAMDDFAELLIGPVALCYYARIVGDDVLEAESQRVLTNLLAIQDLLAELAFDRGDPGQAARAEEAIYMAGIYARMAGLDTPLAQIAGFERGHEHTTSFESILTMGETSPAPLLSDDQLTARVEAHLVAITERAPWRVERYRARFGSTPPVRRVGDGYEAIQINDSWGPVENNRHVHYGLGPIDLWFEASLCVHSRQTLDCAWARRGCAPADLDGSGLVDSTDQSMLDDLRAAGDPAADVDGSGAVDEDDAAYMDAAQGCRI